MRDAEAMLVPRIGRFVFARGGETWADALARRLAGRAVASVESGTAGAFAGLVGSSAWLVRGEVLRTLPGDLRQAAEAARQAASADIGMAMRVRPRGVDLAVGIGLARSGGTTRVTRMAFIGGEAGRRRAAVIAAAELWRSLDPERG